MSLPIGRVLLSASALSAAIGAYVADWNETHIFNPRWPPHARFHNAHTMLLGTALGIFTLYFLWSKRWRGARGLEVGTILSAIYWVTQAGSLLFPGTALTDPEFAHRTQYIGGVMPINQLTIITVFLVLVTVGFFLERRALRTAPAV